MMITKETFVKLITMMMNTIDDKRDFIEDNDYIPDECKDCIMEECDFQKDLITMLTCITIDRFGVIRDYLYDRDENSEYFFGIPNGNKIEVYLLTSPEDLYEYLVEQREGFELLAGKKKENDGSKTSKNRAKIK